MIFWQYPLPYGLTMVAAIAIFALTALRIYALFGVRAFCDFIVVGPTL